jgi:hypothetical protein
LLIAWHKCLQAKELKENYTIIKITENLSKITINYLINNINEEKCKNIFIKHKHQTVVLSWISRHNNYVFKVFWYILEL